MGRDIIVGSSIGYGAVSTSSRQYHQYHQYRRHCHERKGVEGRKGEEGVGRDSGVINRVSGRVRGRDRVNIISSISSLPSSSSSFFPSLPVAAPNESFCSLPL